MSDIDLPHYSNTLKVNQETFANPLTKYVGGRYCYTQIDGRMFDSIDVSEFFAGTKVKLQFSSFETFHVYDSNIYSKTEQAAKKVLINTAYDSNMKVISQYYDANCAINYIKYDGDGKVVFDWLFQFEGCHSPEQEDDDKLHRQSTKTPKEVYNENYALFLCLIL